MLTILMDNLSVNGPEGGKVASVKSGEAINSQYRELGIRQVVSLNTFVTEVLSHLDVSVDSIPVNSFGFTSGIVNVVFKKPTQLISLAGELGIPLSGKLDEMKNELAPTLATSGRGFGGR
jgi:hypothetical protein